MNNKNSGSGNPFANNASGGLNPNQINKDNIFNQDIFSSLIQQNPQQQPTNPQPQPTDTGFKVDETQTQNLTNMLSGIGFNIGGVNEQPQTPPSLEIVARSLNGIYLVNVDEKDYLSNKDKILCPGGHVSVFNPDGRLLAYANNTHIGVYNFASKEKKEVELAGVVAMHFSRTSKYLVAIYKREKENKDFNYFIIIYDTKTLQNVYEYETMKYKKEQWPHIKFVDDDTIAFRTRKPGVIEQLNPLRKFKVTKTIETKQFDYFDISVKLENLLIVTVLQEHTAGYDKNEGRVEVFQYRNMNEPLLSEVIEQAHEIKLIFSPTGRNLLLWTQSFTDRTNQSYYGEHKLFYLNMKTYKLKKVPTYKGPIHDVCWNPNGQQFAVISGFMPAGSVLFDVKCVPKYEFGKHHRNTIKWSPNGKYIALAGFGNLSGDIEFWDVENYKKLGTSKSNSAVSCEWAPNGRKLMTGVLNPRLRVDNDYKIFKYDGTLQNTVDFSQSELYEVLWRPGDFSEIPQSPEKKKPEPTPTTTESKEGTKEGEKPAKRMMNFRGGDFAAQLKAQKGGTSGGRFLEPDERFGQTEEEEKEHEKKTKEEMNKADENRPKIVRAGGQPKNENQDQSNQAENQEQRENNAGGKKKKKQYDKNQGNNNDEQQNFNSNNQAQGGQQPTDFDDKINQAMNLILQQQNQQKSGAGDSKDQGQNQQNFQGFQLNQQGSDQGNQAFLQQQQLQFLLNPQQFGGNNQEGDQQQQQQYYQKNQNYKGNQNYKNNNQGGGKNYNNKKNNQYQQYNNDYGNSNSNNNDNQQQNYYQPQGNAPMQGPPGLSGNPKGKGRYQQYNNNNQ